MTDFTIALPGFPQTRWSLERLIYCCNFAKSRGQKVKLVMLKKGLNGLKAENIIIDDPLCPN